MSILGIDTNFATVNWSAFKNGGYDFAIIKASEGYPDGSASDKECALIWSTRLLLQTMQGFCVVLITSCRRLMYRLAQRQIICPQKHKLISWLTT